jgi:Flp pilus assembly protein TadB
VENGLVNFQTIRLTLIVNLVAAALLGALLWVAVPAAIGRPLRLWEVFVLAAAALVLLELWRWHRQRREREQNESLRDSALW